MKRAFYVIFCLMLLACVGLLTKQMLAQTNANAPEMVLPSEQTPSQPNYVLVLKVDEKVKLVVGEDYKVTYSPLSAKLFAEGFDQSILKFENGYFYALGFGETQVQLTANYQNEKIIKTIVFEIIEQPDSQPDDLIPIEPTTPINQDPQNPSQEENPSQEDSQFPQEPQPDLNENQPEPPQQNEDQSEDEQDENAGEIQQYQLVFKESPNMQNVEFHFEENNNYILIDLIAPNEITFTLELYLDGQLQKNVNIKYQILEGNCEIIKDLSIMSLSGITDDLTIKFYIEDLNIEQILNIYVN